MLCSRQALLSLSLLLSPMLVHGRHAAAASYPQKNLTILLSLPLTSSRALLKSWMCPQTSPSPPHSMGMECICCTLAHPTDTRPPTTAATNQSCPLSPPKPAAGRMPAARQCLVVHGPVILVPEITVLLPPPPVKIAASHLQLHDC